MSTVSTSFDIVFDVKKEVSKSVGVVYQTRRAVASSGYAVQYDVRKRISAPASLVYNVRKIISPGKVFSLVHSVRSRVSRSKSVRYNVVVPLSAGGSFSTAFSSAYDSAVGVGAKEFSLVYGVRARVSKSNVVQYDTLATGTSQVSKPFTILYHTLVDPTVSQLMTVPIEVDSLPPQIVTTSF